VCTLTLSVVRFASQPFVGYSMVLQSVIRAVTRPMGRHRVCEGVASFRKADYARFSCVPLFSFHFTPSRLSIPANSTAAISLVIDGSWVKPIAYLPSTIEDSLLSPNMVLHVSRLVVIIFTRHCLRHHNPPFFRRRVRPKGEVWLPKT